MPLTLDENPAQYQIRAYRPGSVQINELIYYNSIIIAPEKLIVDWPPKTISALTSKDLNIIAEWRPSLFLLGTGDTLTFPPLEVYGALINQGIGVEIMNNRAACMTYTALTAEGRNVVAGLIITRH